MKAQRHLTWVGLMLKVTVVFSNGGYESRGWAPINDHGGFFSPTGKPEFESAAYWMNSAQAKLLQRVNAEDRIVGKAKNVVFYLGDGMGLATVTTARILQGQQVEVDTKFGEEAILNLDLLPWTGLSKTYCTDSQVADSACAATAFLCGSKTNIGTIGVTPDVTLGNCTAENNPKNRLSSILAWAQAAGKSTGFVTTTRITHATPAGSYAHTSNRDWESDADMVELGGDPNLCEDIAKQLIFGETGKNLNVIMGGGRAKFRPINMAENGGGVRLDGQDLIAAWLKDKTDAGYSAAYVRSAKDLRKLEANTLDYLLGIFAPDHLSYFHEREEKDEPMLEEMVEKAIEILSKNPNGYILFVEGGRIDLAHHQNWYLRALWETEDFDRGIKKGDDMTNDKDTLLVVTADHSHSFTFSGYAPRGNPIYGFAGEGLDGYPYQTLGYANGPGFINFTDGYRHDPSNDPVESLDYRSVPLVPLEIDTHGGEDVGIWAKGPFAHLYSGVFEQNYIPHLMAYAACIGPGLKYCDKQPNPSQYYFNYVNSMLQNGYKYE